MKLLAGLVLALFLTVTGYGEEVCLRCHGGNPPAGQEKAAKVDVAAIAGSIHGSLQCSDCHDVNPDKNHASIAQAVYCGKCHTDALEGYNESPHVQGREVSVAKLPSCISCHDGHTILSKDDPNSRTNHINSVTICIDCHEDAELTAQSDLMPDAAMIRGYENSIHGVALLKEGNMSAPACVDCHGSHTFKPSDDPDSPLFKGHIAETCGKCHEEIAEQYQTSVHGTMLAEGVLESPTCTNCHGEHDIKEHSDPESKVYAANIPKTCNACHSSEAIVGKFGLKADRIETFKESFHGVAIELGETKAANCASCHGVHNIYPQDDPRSLVNSNNIETTCGKCHEDLPPDFAHGTFHVSASDEDSGGRFYVRSFYIWFISILIALFILYRILEYKRRAKRE
jgi:hypothetical protein